MKRYYIAIIGCLLCLFCGCSDKDNGEDENKLPPLEGTIFSESFMQVYVYPQDFKLSLYGNKMMIFVHGDSCFYRVDGSDTRYKELSERFNDTQYNGSVIPYDHVGIAETFLITEIVCDKEYYHIPAGESLMSLVKLHGTTTYPFIQSGYKVTYDWKEFNEDFLLRQDFGYSPINKYLHEITQDDLILSAIEFYLLLPEDIPESENYTFTVTFETADGVIHKNVRSKGESVEEEG